RRLASRGHKPLILRKGGRLPPADCLMLVEAAQAASAFLIVQLRRLASRGHKPLILRKGGRLPPADCLMLVEAAQAASAFLIVQLQALALRPLRSLGQGKVRLSVESSTVSQR
ncbi:hypothetical protein, partial [Metabacillus sp. 84]|uniref:hypothetical protein n=1 Tax=Metabacillus sp. 84 TaxID=3404705 RepID=UPI003CEE4FA3